MGIEITTVATIVFLGAGLFVAYVLFGYPLLLAIASRRGRGPAAKAPTRKTVTIILPVHNGERWIAAKLQSIHALEYPPELIDVIVVSDGSTDATEAIVESMASPSLRLICIPRSGKAVALNTALQQARGEILFFTDVRQRLSPDSLVNLVNCFADPEVGVASGELFIGGEGDSDEEANVGVYWRYEKWIRKRLSHIDSVLGATGCIYAMRRELAVPLPPDTLIDDVYQPLAAFFAGYRVILDDSAKAYDYPTSLQMEFQRKVRTLAGNYQILRARPGLLSLKNRMWIHFVSHKFARLLLPFAFILIAISSFGLPSPWREPALAGQALFYGAGLIDRWLPDGARLKQLTAPIRTFIVLITAAFCATRILFVPSAQLWKTTEVRQTRSVRA